MAGAAESMVWCHTLKANSRDGAVAATDQALCAGHGSRGCPLSSWQLCRFVYTSAAAKCNLALAASQQAWPQRVVGIPPPHTHTIFLWGHHHIYGLPFYFCDKTLRPRQLIEERMYVGLSLSEAESKHIMMGNMVADRHARYWRCS